MQPRNIYDRLWHDQEISGLRVNVEQNFQHLVAARKLKRRYFYLAPNDFIDWLEDINRLPKNDASFDATVDFYECLVAEYPVSANWCQYINFLIDSKVTDEHTLSTFDRAFEIASCDFKNAHLLYSQYLEYTATILSTSESIAGKLWTVWLSFLKTSHQELDKTFELTSAFVTKAFPDSYDKHMIQSNKIYQNTKKSLHYYTQQESSLANEPDAWCKYLQHIAKYSPDASTRLQVTLIRSILSAEGPNSTTWEAVWLTYIQCLYKIHSNVETHLYDYVRAYPSSARSYAEYIRNCLLFKDADINFPQMVDRFEHTDLRHQVEYDLWKALATAVLFHETKMSSDIPAHLDEYVEIAFGNSDVFHAVEKLSIAILEEKNETKQALSIAERMVDVFSDQCEVWLFTSQLMKNHGATYSELSQFFSDAISNCLSMDWPERIVQEALSFELVSGTVNSYNEKLVKANEELKKVDRESGQPQEQPVIASKEEPTEDNKSHAGRNRESLKVKIANISKSASENDVKRMFSDCGVIADLNLVEHAETLEAIIEFESEPSLMAALTRDKKIMNGQQIMVSRHLEATIWVSNYPPSLTQAEVRKVFEDCGEIISVRFPSLKTNQQRRFCYLEFARPEGAAAAVSKYNGTMLKDSLSETSYKLVVAISRPPPKVSTRSAKLHRQVYVKNLNFQETTKSKLLALFEQYGEIESIDIPLKEEMRAKGCVNGGFAFVAFKNEPAATKAVAADGKMLDNRKIQVHKAQKQTDHHFNPADYDDQRSISVTGFPETMRKEQLEAIVSEKLGSITKLYVDFKTCSAVIEFAASGSTKRALELENASFAGFKLQVGTKNSFGNSLQNHRPKQKLMVPTVVRKKRRIEP